MGGIDFDGGFSKKNQGGVAPCPTPYSHYEKSWLGQFADLGGGEGLTRKRGVDTSIHTK